jgi:hypothetical protein
MTDQRIIGAIKEARQLGEALLNLPTLTAFQDYRRALTTLAAYLGTEDIQLARSIMLEDELKDYAYTQGETNA